MDGSMVDAVGQTEVRIETPSGVRVTAVFVAVCFAAVCLLGAVSNLSQSHYGWAIGAAVAAIGLSMPWLLLTRPRAIATPTGLELRSYTSTMRLSWPEVDRLFAHQDRGDFRLFVLTTTSDLVQIPLVLKFVSNAHRREQVDAFLTPALGFRSTSQESAGSRPEPWFGRRVGRRPV